MLKVENVTKYYGDLKAVDNLSFEVNPGEIFGLLGVNGAGKTTTFRMIMGLLDKTDGKITLNGKNIDYSVTDSIGFLTEERSLLTKLTVREQAIYFGALKGMSDEDILKIIRAGMQAPGSRLGAEPWEFVVVKDKETLARLGEIKPRVTNAPVAIVLVANIERAFYKTVWQQDMGAAAENMLLEAVNLGLGGLWNGVAPEEERMAKIGEIIGIDDISETKPYCIITLGYPAEGWENKFMDKFDEERIHYEKY